jgi:Zn finger protein HypA/HybF involved in hydrogenase expression
MKWYCLDCHTTFDDEGLFIYEDPYCPNCGSDEITPEDDRSK